MFLYFAGNMAKNSILGAVPRDPSSGKEKAKEALPGHE